MSGRLVPYVSKAPPNFEQSIEEALALKMYLISEKGPTSLLFTDEEETIVKMQIGLEVTCSCNNVKNQQCKHTLYALLKKFRVDKKSPLLWQGSYIDMEIEGLISGKYSEKSNANSSKKNYLKANSKFKNQPSKVSKQDDKRQEVEEDATCPICQEEMSENEALTFCRKQCGNNFHGKCLKIWCQHKLQQGDQKISCPMCRCDLGRNILEQIKNDENSHKARHETHANKKCKGCSKKPIVGNIYHCLICQNLDLCHSCFENYTHIQHNKFLTKKIKTDEWKLAPERDKYKYELFKDQIYNFKLGQIKKNEHYNIQQHLFKPSEIQEEQKNNNILQELVFCLPLVSDFQKQNKKLNDLQIVGLDVNKINIAQQCSICNTTNQNAEQMRRLSCGHAVDDQCLFQLFLKGDFFCPIDQQPILPGYNSAMGITNTLQKLNTQIANSNIKKKPPLIIKKGSIQNQNKENNQLSNLQQIGLNLTGGRVGIGEKRFNEGIKMNSQIRSQQSNRSLQKKNTYNNNNFTPTTQDFGIQGSNQNFQINQQKLETSSIKSNNNNKQKNFMIKKIPNKRQTTINREQQQQQQQQQQNMDFNIVGGGMSINTKQNNQNINTSQQQQQQQQQYLPSIRSGSLSRNAHIQNF